MTTLSNLQATIPPIATVTIRVEDMVPAKGRPLEPIVAGIRIPSLEQRLTIKKVAPIFAKDYGVELNEALVRLYCAYGLCDANDVSKPWRWFDRPQDQAFTDLTERGASRIHDAIQKLEVETSPVFAEATDEDVAELYSRIANGDLANLNEFDFSAVLRHLRHALDIIRAASASEPHS